MGINFADVVFGSLSFGLQNQRIKMCFSKFLVMDRKSLSSLHRPVDFIESKEIQTPATPP